MFYNLNVSSHFLGEIIAKLERTQFHKTLFKHENNWRNNKHTTESDRSTTLDWTAGDTMSQK